MKITEHFLRILKRRLKISEGFRPIVYLDTLGISTFGYGFTRIEKDEADAVLQLKLRKIIESDLVLFLDEIGHLNEKRLMVLIEMIYQLGAVGVKGFKKFRIAILAEDWEEAAHQMLHSKWHAQTPQRCERLANEFKDS